MRQPQGLAPYQPMRSLESAPGRVFTAWRSPGRFTKNPDLVALPSGKLLAVYADTDKHWAEGVIRLTLISSVDRGRTWGDPQVIIESDRAKREPHWVTPRLSRLRDGRLALLCDLDDYEHAHEDQEPGIHLWWSEDEGRTWSEPGTIGVPGIEPDRMVELPDGRLVIGAHMTFRETQKLGEFACFSNDRGRTWSSPVIIAQDAVHNYCEGAIVHLDDGTLVCVMRDNNHNSYPSQVAFSFDGGRRWTEPQEAPFAGDRPFAGQLADGRLLVTFRNQGGNRGSYAWLGDIRHELGYRCSALHQGPEQLSLEATTGLLIAHAQPATTSYHLLPPESFRSEILWEATLRVAGRPEDAVAAIQIAHVNCRLAIRPTGLYLGEPSAHSQAVDRCWPADMTQWRTVRIQHRGGLLRILLDGQEVLRYTVLREALWAPTCFGSAPNGVGQSWWRYVHYHVRNPSEPEFLWSWDARSGAYPDQYELDRMLELHANSHDRPDNGYSTWRQFDDGEILVLDYTNQGDPLGQAHIVGCLFRPEDFVTMGRR
jgi:hypothetical protein